jgi:hypothetical protein
MARPKPENAKRWGQDIFLPPFFACRVFGSSRAAGVLALQMREIFWLVIFTCTDLYWLVLTAIGLG